MLSIIKYKFVALFVINVQVKKIIY